MPKKVNPLAPYDYTLPPELIALKPAHPRDTARLLVYDRSTKQHTDDIFLNLATHLPPHSVVVVNQTKVIPAAITVRKKTGGAIQGLVLNNHDQTLHIIANKQLLVGQDITIGPHLFQVIRQSENHFWLRPHDPKADLPTLIDQYGHTPLPPYLKHSPLSEPQRRQQYQTVFAKHAGSAAAPTASLHFTPRVLTNLNHHGHQLAAITLHVGLGTFASVSPQQLTTQKLHTEKFFIDKTDAAVINQAKAAGRSIIAVGTTVCRALETATHNHQVLAGPGSTDLFIQPGYTFKTIDHLITNFHVPKSSLLMLVAALIGTSSLKQLYQHAIQERYRFFSFGDAMLIR